LDLSFENKEIRKICEDEDIATLRYGSAVAKELQKRLADIDAAKSVNDLIVGQPGEVFKKVYSNYKIDLCDGYRLIFCANPVYIPLLEDKINWPLVRRIKILQIENTNEQIK